MERQTTVHTHTFGQFTVTNWPRVDVSEQWEEVGVPAENQRRHTQKAEPVIQSCCEASALNHRTTVSPGIPPLKITASLLRRHLAPMEKKGPGNFKILTVVRVKQRPRHKKPLA